MGRCADADADADADTNTKKRHLVLSQRWRLLLHAAVRQCNLRIEASIYVVVVVDVVDVVDGVHDAAFARVEFGIYFGSDADSDLYNVGCKLVYLKCDYYYNPSYHHVLY